MLLEFLLNNQEEILTLTEDKIRKLKELGPSSIQVNQGLPIFYNQLKAAIQLQQESPMVSSEKNSAMKISQEEGVAKEAKSYGKELLRLNYSLSHIMYVYGSLIQSISEIATKKNFQFNSSEFQELNQCFDIAIEGAISGYELARMTHESNHEIERLGFLAHEIRNALTSANISLQLIKKGSGGFNGTTGKVLGKSLKRIEEIINRSLMEVRLRSTLKMHFQKVYLLQMIDQIVTTAEIEAQSKNENIEVRVDPSLVIEVDQELFHSALSNLIQNAIKYTHVGGKIQVRANIVGDQIIIEVEDECGGLVNPSVDLFKSFEQQNENQKGLGLGLTISKRAIERNQGTIGVANLPGKGCIFKISLPKPKANAQDNLQESSSDNSTSPQYEHLRAH